MNKDEAHFLILSKRVSYKIKNAFFLFTISFIILVFLFVTGITSAAQVNKIVKTYPLSPSSICGDSKNCSTILEIWNNATWDDDVDDDIDSQSKIAGVRWYNTEGNCDGEKCDSQLHRNDTSCPYWPNVTQNNFCMVTDEFGNVLLSAAMGDNQTRYEKLHNMSEMLRNASINGLQCWKSFINGTKSYQNFSQLCIVGDSASDASIRILGAYAIACAKQTINIWSQGGIDYCGDYEEQGNAIFGMGTVSHGEIIRLPNGRYFLANGYNNAGAAPTTKQSFRPDYYELQFLMDFAEYKNNATLVQAVLDILDSYESSLGDTHIHQGKTGHFAADGFSNYTCDEGPLNCTNYPIEHITNVYMDNTDTWRVIPAIGGLYNVHPEDINATYNSSIFNYWWTHYGGGNISITYSSDKPIEIYSNLTAGIVKLVDNSYKTSAMWLPLSVQFNSVYAINLTGYLVDQYDFAQSRFSGAQYYGAYYSQFAQRAIGSITGMIDPLWWNPQNGQLISGTDDTILILLVNPLNGTTQSSSSVNLQVNVTNGNISSTSSAITHINHTFNSNNGSWTGSYALVSAGDGFLNMTGNTFSPAVNLSRFAVYQLEFKTRIGTSVNNYKFYPLTTVGSFGSNDKFYFEDNVGLGKFYLKHEPGFETITDSIDKNSNITLLITINKTVPQNRTMQVNITWNNGTSNGSVLSVPYNFSANQNASVNQNGTGIEIGTFTGDLRLYNFKVINITNLTMIAGNSSMNVTFINDANGAVLCRVNGTASGSTASCNWSGLSNGVAKWRVNVTSENNNVLSKQHVFITDALGIDVKNLTVAYNNLTERVFRFVINNTLTSSSMNVSWNLTTGNGNLFSQYNTTLQAGEDVIVFAYHNYTAPGSYTVKATATNGTYTNTEEISINV